MKKGSFKNRIKGFYIESFGKNRLQEELEEETLRSEEEKQLDEAQEEQDQDMGNPEE